MVIRERNFANEPISFFTFIFQYYIQQLSFIYHSQEISCHIISSHFTPSHFITSYHIKSSLISFHLISSHLVSRYLISPILLSLVLIIFLTQYCYLSCSFSFSPILNRRLYSSRSRSSRVRERTLEMCTPNDLKKQKCTATKEEKVVILES